MVVIGVFNSWLTLAVKLRRTDSVSASSVAMLLKAEASRPISSSPSTGTRTEKSPLAKARVAAAICRRGFTRLVVTK